MISIVYHELAYYKSLQSEIPLIYFFLEKQEIIRKIRIDPYRSIEK